MRRSSIFWGLVLTLLGVIFLLNNLGVFYNINIWLLVGPAFLILLGIWILLGPIVFRHRTEQAAVSLEGTSSGSLRFNHGAGRLNVTSGASPGNLVEGDFAGGVEVKAIRHGDVTEATLSVPFQFMPFYAGPQGMVWDVRLSLEVPMSLELNTGASETRIDLNDLKVTEFKLQTGASSTSLTLPAQAGTTRARVQSGAASVTINIPQGVAAHIRARGGLASIHVDQARFPRQGDIYLSSDYETAVNKVDLDVETGVGSVDIR